MSSLLFVVLGVFVMLAVLVGVLFAVVWFAGSAGRRAQGHQATESYGRSMTLTARRSSIAR